MNENTGMKTILIALMFLVQTTHAQIRVRPDSTIAYPLTGTKGVTGTLYDVNRMAMDVEVVNEGLATDAKLDEVITAVEGISIGGGGGGGGGLTNTELRASAVPVSGSLTCNAGSGTLAVSMASAPTTAVTGTFWQATQPVSIASMPSTPVTGTFWQATQPISASALPLPSGAATNAKLDDVITAVQGISGGGGGGGLTDTQLRATAVPVSGSLTCNAGSGTLAVSMASAPTTAVTGTFWQATQPISASALPLPSGAATLAKQPALGTAGTASADVISVQGIASMTALKVDGSGVTQPVSGTFWQATQPISAAALPLPSGAATLAKQPALGTAGTASADVISVQGIASMTALKVDGSDVTQPVSGTFWQATQPVSGTFWQATQPVSIASMPSTPVTGTFWQATQPVSGTVTETNSGTINSILSSIESIQDQLTADTTGLINTSAKLGTIAMGATTTAAPSYTNAKVNPLSLTTVGNLRVDGSSVTQPVSIATAPALVASSAIIGNVRIDQTTPGTTNGVQINAALPAGANAIGKLAANSGVDIGDVTIDNATLAVTKSGTWDITNAGTFAVQATVAAGATNIAKAEDVGSADADVGVPSLAVRKATPANTSGTDGDYEFLQMSAGRLWTSTVIDTALPAGTNGIGKLTANAGVTIGAVEIAASQTIGIAAGAAVIGHVINDTGSTTAVTGNVASTVADGANVTLGAKADAKSTATDTTAVSEMSVLKQISASVQAPPSQAVTNAGTFAVQAAESDGANVTLGAKADAKSTATDTTAVTVMSVLKQISASVQAPPTQAVTESGTWTVQPGNTPNTSPWLMTINDGTNAAKVTAASTAAVAADKALVVSQNPTGGNPCINPNATLVSINGATSGTAAVQIVALSGTTKIYICSLNVIGVSGTTPTFSLVQGTGSNCANGQTVVQQSWTTAAGTIYAFANPVAVGVAGNALCYLDTGTTPIQKYTLTYVQQ